MERVADHTEAMKISSGGVENMSEYSIFDNGYSSAGGLISYYADDQLEDFVVIRHGLGYSLSTGRGT